MFFNMHIANIQIFIKYKNFFDKKEQLVSQ